MPRGVEFNLNLRDCAAMATPSHVLPVVLRLPPHGFLPAVTAFPYSTAVEDIPEFVRQKTRTEEASALGRWSVGGFQVIPTWTDDDLTGTFRCWESVEGIPSCHLGTFLQRHERFHVATFSQRLLDLGHDLYTRVRPALGWIDKSWAQRPSFVEVQHTSLVSIGWANWFGPRYVERYGGALLLSIPGHTTFHLDDGGIFHQLTPTFFVEDACQASALRKAVSLHFRQADLEIACQVPHISHHIFGPEPPPPYTEAAARATFGTLAEFRRGLKALLATTLTLIPGERLKVLYLEWERLPAAYRQVALTAVRETALAEVAAHPQARIRFEFSELFPELVTLMGELVWQNGQLSYEQIDMPQQTWMPPAT